jgi:membrane peptidoglycan carboxypeptidase
LGQTAPDPAYWSVVSAQTLDSGGPAADPKPRSRARRILKWVLFTLLSLVALGAVAVAIAYATIQPPQPNELANAQASIVYYDDGKTEMARLSDAQGNRESVPLAKVPDHVQKAVLAAEDRDFYTNPGFSPTGIGRSVWQALRGADVQGGGSTITQQYVKNYFLTSDRSLTRKFKEIIISVKIDQQQGKDQILENYLNTIYYGRGAYGIQTASKAYFNKDVSQLSVAEGATLAAVVNAPSLFDPALGVKQKANLTNRVGYVLDGMVEEGWLSKADRDKVTGPAETVPPAKNTAIAGPSGYIVDAVRKELGNTLKLSDSDIDRGGLRVTTTINKTAQDAAVAGVQKYLPKEAPDVQAGLTAIKPGDGAIVAMYGGADFQKKPLNASTDAIMQAGSTFKPFALIAGLQQGISTKTMFNGNSPITVGTTKVPNEFNQSFGMIDLRRATAKSVNTVFVGLNNRIGPANTKNAAIAAGIPEKAAGLDDTLTNVLGTASPHVVDVASAYATIAAQGQKATPYLVAAVTSDTTDVDYKVDKQVSAAFGADVAADTIDALQQVTASGGTGARASGLGRPTAGKTGTSDEHKSVWFTGFVPQLATSVGMFRDVDGVPQPLDNIPGLSVSEVGGSSLPLSMWLDFMKAATQGMDVQAFPKRAGIGDNAVPTTSTPSTTTTTQPSTTTTTTTAPPTTTTTTAPPPVTTTTTTPPPAITTTRTQGGGPRPTTTTTTVAPNPGP